MVLTDRLVSSGFYDAGAGGDPLLYQHGFYPTHKLAICFRRSRYINTVY